MAKPQLLSFEACINNRKRRQAMDLFYEAYHAQLRREFPEAIQTYRQSIALFPTAEAHTFLGWAFSFMGELDNAIAECQRAIEVDPEFGNPYNDIGAYLIAQGDYQGAMPYLQGALSAKRYKAYHFAHFNMGRACEYLGDMLNAYRHYKLALEMEPRYKVASKALDHLKKAILN